MKRKLLIPIDGKWEKIFDDNFLKFCLFVNTMERSETMKDILVHYYSSEFGFPFEEARRYVEAVDRKVEFLARQTGRTSATPEEKFVKLIYLVPKIKNVVERIAHENTITLYSSYESSLLYYSVAAMQFLESLSAKRVPNKRAANY